jgi:hypothetical protein
MEQQISSVSSYKTSPALVDNLAEGPRAEVSDFVPSDKGVWEKEAIYRFTDVKKISLPSSSGISIGMLAQDSGEKIFVAQGSSIRRRFWFSSKKIVREHASWLVGMEKQRIRSTLSCGMLYTLEYALGIFQTTLFLLQKPLSVILFFYILSYLLTFVSNSIRMVVTPICWTPGLSRMPFCYNLPAPLPKIPEWASYPELAKSQGLAFEYLLDDVVGSSSLSLEIKKAEITATDLVALVKVSHFKSKQALLEHLEIFAQSAKTTGRGLQRLNSRVSGAIDK